MRTPHHSMGKQGLKQKNKFVPHRSTHQSRKPTPKATPRWVQARNRINIKKDPSHNCLPRKRAYLGKHQMSYYANFGESMATKRHRKNKTALENGPMKEPEGQPTHSRCNISHDLSQCSPFRHRLSRRFAIRISTANWLIGMLTGTFQSRWKLSRSVDQ